MLPVILLSIVRMILDYTDDLHINADDEYDNDYVEGKEEKMQEEEEDKERQCRLAKHVVYNRINQNENSDSGISF